MTIYWGDVGSINFYWNDLLISSFGVHSKKKTLENYKNMGEFFIRDGLERGNNLEQIKQVCLYHCITTWRRKYENKAIWKCDHQLFCACLYSLIKLKFIKNEDDYILYIPRNSKTCKFDKT